MKGVYRKLNPTVLVAILGAVAACSDSAGQSRGDTPASDTEANTTCDVVTPTSGGSLIDANGNVWAFLGGSLSGDGCDVVYGKNGVMPYGGAAAIDLVISNGVLHQLSCIYGWYHDTGSGFAPDSASKAAALDALVAQCASQGAGTDAGAEGGGGGGCSGGGSTGQDAGGSANDAGTSASDAGDASSNPGDAGAGSGGPPGMQTPVDPSMSASQIQSIIDSVGAGNSVAFAPGTYSASFQIPAGVYLYSTTNGAAVIQGSLDGTGANGWTVDGFSIQGGIVQASSTSGARITRCTFNEGTDIGDGFGAGCIRGMGPNGLTVDHNAFNGVTGTTVQFWNLDNSTITLNTFTNCRQGIDPDFSEGGHGNDTLSSNYFTGASRMPIETSSGGASGFTFSNIVVTGNYAENFQWPTSGDTSGNVGYSIVGGDGVLDATIQGNTVLGNGAMGIGIELNQTGTVTGNRIDSIGWSGVEVYAASGFDVENNDITNCTVDVGNYQNGSGTIQNNEDPSVQPPKPVTGPTAP